MKKVVIVDYGVGNIKSVQRSLEKVGSDPFVSSDPYIIETADRLILPGVGAFKSGMEGLRNEGILDSIISFAKKGNPLLGICLGMQMLLDESEEQGHHVGLGLIAGIVKGIPKITEEGSLRKIPHIGWNSVHKTHLQHSWYGTCMDNINAGDYCYFVHSYSAVPNTNLHILAHCEYEGLELAAVIKTDNITGVQFHPEKSGRVGLRIMESFLKE